jgi:hypothetical protein
MNPLVEGDHSQAYRLASRALPRLIDEPDTRGEPPARMAWFRAIRGRSAPQLAGRAVQLVSV